MHQSNQLTRTYRKGAYQLYH